MLSCAKWHANVKLHARDTNLYQRKYTRFLLSKTNWVQHRTRISSLCNAVSLTYRIVSRRYCISVLICLHHALHRTYLHPFFHKNRDASQVHWRVQTNIGYDRSSSMDHRRWLQHCTATSKFTDTVPTLSMRGRFQNISLSFAIINNICHIFFPSSTKTPIEPWDLYSFSQEKKKPIVRKILKLTTQLFASLCRFLPNITKHIIT